MARIRTAEVVVSRMVGTGQACLLLFVGDGIVWIAAGASETIDAQTSSHGAGQRCPCQFTSTRRSANSPRSIRSYVPYRQQTGAGYHMTPPAVLWLGHSHRRCWPKVGTISARVTPLTTIMVALATTGLARGCRPCLRPWRRDVDSAHDLHPIAIAHAGPSFSTIGFIALPETMDS